MNEAMLKELIKHKLNAAEIIVNSLPPEISDEIRNLGRVVLESVNESCNDMKARPAKKPKSPDKLDNIPIE